MASAAYTAWVRAGRPWTLAAPLRQQQKVLQGYGYVVYAYPDTSHQQAATPEDHTSYSATGWPVPSPRWYAFAIDLMPGRGGMADLTRIARQVIKDKDAGVPGTEWIKYMNWTDEAGRVWQTSWKPHKVTRTSSDKGHIHISGRSDMVTNAGPVYDPVARMNGVVPPPAPVRSSEDMAGIARAGDGKLYFSIGGFSHLIKDSDVGDIAYIASQGWYTLAKGPDAGNDEWEKGGLIRRGWGEAWAGPIYQAPGDLSVSVAAETVVEALESTEGQAALKKAADAAEDS